MSRNTDTTDAALWNDPALMGLVESDTAAVLWSLDGGRVIAASAATAGLAPGLRAAGGESLRGRLRRVAATLSAGSGIRLERVTLPQGYGVARLLLECHRVATRRGEFLLTVLRGQLPRLPRVVEAGFDAFDMTDARAPMLNVATQHSSEWRADAQAAVSEPNAVERLFAYAGQRATIRFIWESDAEGRITRVSQELMGLVGRDAGRIEGKLWRDLVAQGIVHDPQDAVSTVMAKPRDARHDSWSGLEVLWRIGDAKAFPLLPVELAGIPMHDSRHRFQGYRGFGLARVGRLRHADGGVATPPKPIKPVVQAPVSSTAIEADAVIAPAVQPKDVAHRTHLSDNEKQAFRDIARALSGSRLQDDEVSQPAPLMPEASHAKPDYEQPRVSRKRTSGADKESKDAPVLAAAADDQSQPIERPAASVRRRAARLRLVEPPEPAANDPLPIEADAQDMWQVQNAPSDDVWDDPEPPVDFAPTKWDDAPILSSSASEKPRQIHTDATTSFTHIADRLPLGLLVSRGSEVLFVNRALLDLLGYDHEQFFMAAGGLRALFMSAPSGSDAPLSLRTSKGTPVSADARMATIQWEGRAATIMSFRRAMEPQAEAHLRALERELRHQEARVLALDTILDTATDGIVTLDGLGRLMSLNSSAEVLLGCDETEVVGAPLWHLLTPQSRTEAAAYFEGLRAGGLASVLNDGLTVTARAQHGGDIPLMMIMGRLAQDPDESPGDETNANKAQRYFAILRDTSATQTASPSAESAAVLERQAEFLARVSHEIRTPLNAIIGFTEIMLEERLGPIGVERYREYLRDIHASGGQVISLVNDLLDLARIEAGRLDLAPAHVSLNDVVSGCVGLMMPQAGREQVVLRTSLTNKLPPVNIDERALQQIILNLLSNAVKFTDAGGQVIVSTAQADDGGATLRIRDTGIGMTRAQVDAAMEPFSHLSTTRLGHGQGTGLGLPLTRALVEASGGRFHVSSARNEGTLVEIAFPLKREPAPTKPQVKVRPSSQ
ncbi:ATP-binding protein [Pseudochelatococcus sp. G4_1912]|uniref:ATP-binding protein n=1 Tax=Pseudochelatococcus sp. G4_1912 TaxID=3114288 RepID=UPI0039C5AF9F